MNRKLYILYPGNLYDEIIIDSINYGTPYMEDKNLNNCIELAAQNDVKINTVAISHPTSEYMDSLIPITGLSYSDQDGIDALIGQIINDHAAQKEAVKNIAAGDSDGDSIDSKDVFRFENRISMQRLQGIHSSMNYV